MKLIRIKEGWSPALFLAGMMIAVGWALVATEWAEGLGVVPWAGLAGVLAGLLLGWSAFGSLSSHLLGAVYGLAWVGFLLGRELPAGLTGRERIIELVARLGYWIRQVVTGGTGRDTFVFVMLLGLVSWALGFNAGWNTYRRLRLWLAIVPLGAAILVIAYYYAGSAPMTGYLALFLLFALLYIARTHLVEQENRWQRERVTYSPELRPSIFRAGTVVALIVLALAWALPSAAAVPRMLATWRNLSKPLHVLQDEWKRLFSTLQGGPEVRSGEPFGRLLALGGPQQPQDALVMDVDAPLGHRYYWRGATYAYYTGNRWEVLEEETMQLIPGRQPPGMAQYALRSTVPQTVTRYVSGQRTLVGASRLLTVDQDAEAHIDLTGDAPLEFIRVFSIVPLAAGEQHHVTSDVSVADGESLRQASTDYPGWALGRYLQLPPAFPERVLRLAQEITADVGTPYDRAIALERYLRRTIAYNLSPPELPEGRDYVDFLLFDSREGYCTGYATAMVMMARSLGIPARLAVGYAQGQYDVERGSFRVWETDAHSWPELYFPEYGWIEFEPTAAQTPLVRPELPLEPYGQDRLLPGRDEEFFSESEPDGYPSTSFPGDWQVEPLATRSRLPLWLGAVGLALIALVSGGWWTIENWGFARLTPVERAYARLLRLGAWLGLPLRVSQTPAEWGGSVAARVPEAREPVDRIIGLYLRARFGQGNVNAPEAGAAWKQVRPRLWHRWVRNLVPTATGRGERT